MKYYENRLAFVFGGSEGIGASVCKDLCKSGARVVAFSRNIGKLQRLEQEIRQSYPRAQITTASVDVTDFNAVQACITDTVQKHGSPFFVMNFAGLARPGFIEGLDINEYRKMMDLNYFGTLHVLKALSKCLIKQREGHVVTCSSIAGYLGLFGYTGYCASKFAVIGFSEALKREWAPYNIKVSVLCPPNTKTPGLEEENKGKPPEILATEEKVTVVEAAFVSEQLLKKLPTNEFMLVPTFDGRVANYLNRLSPRIIDLFVKRKEITF